MSQFTLLKSLVSVSQTDSAHLVAIEEAVMRDIQDMESTLNQSALGAREAFDALMAMRRGETQTVFTQQAIQELSTEELVLRKQRVSHAAVEHRGLRIALVFSGCAAFLLLAFIISRIRKGYLDLSSLLQTNAQQSEMLRLRTRELEQTVGDLDQFAYVASHDLKAPLRGISNLAQWISEDAGDALSAESHQQLEMLKRRVLRMDALVNGILEYASAGRTDPEKKEVNVSNLLHEILDLLTPPEGVSVNIETEMPSLYTPKAPFLQIWMNLITNAIKYGVPNGGEIRLGARQNDSGDYEYYVADSGPGIEPRFHQKIFGIFQTLTPRDRQESTGIGLAVVKKLVERVGGRIWLESDIGTGACFWFTYPVEEVKSESGEEARIHKLQVFRWGKRGQPRQATQDLVRLDDKSIL